MGKPVNQRSGLGLLFEGLGTAARDATLGVIGCGLLAVAVNAWLHPNGITLWTDQAYEILVPCPEPGGEVTPMAAQDPRLDDRASFLVDARSQVAYSSWHLAGATNLTFDYLDPTPDEAVQGLARAAARSRAERVVVYGDGEDPDSGEQLAREISARGIKNVFFVRGGAQALQARAGSGP